MKLSASTLLFAAALGAFAFAVLGNSPSGAPWAMFFDDPAAWTEKAAFLIRTFCRPAMLSFSAIVLLQLQFRLASSGANKRTVFSVCLFACGAMVTSLRALAFLPGSAPSYVLGMALGYTVMSRLYAVRLRMLGPVRIPWPVWRGDLPGVQKLERRIRAEAAAPNDPHPPASAC